MFIVQSLNRAWLVFVFVSSLAWLLCAGTAAQAQSKAQPKEASDKPAEIKKLLKERCDLLEEVVATLMEHYKAGTVDITRILQAEREVLRATLDLDEGPEKRTAKLQELQKTAEQFVQLAEAKFKIGVTTKIDVLQAKVVLLEVRIELLREQRKAKPDK